jgi:hypothetical protein
VTDWKERGQLESKSSGITFLSEPTVHTVPGVHGSDTAYRYRTRKTASLSDARLDVLQRFDIHEIYRASVEACVRDLGLDTATSARPFGDCIGRGMTGMFDFAVPPIAAPPLAVVAAGEARAVATSHLQRLEAESISIMRKVAAEFRKPVTLYWFGKDSSVLLHLAMKAFHPAKPPFPLLHVDITLKFSRHDRVSRSAGPRARPRPSGPRQSRRDCARHRPRSATVRRTIPT